MESPSATIAAVKGRAAADDALLGAGDADDEGVVAGEGDVDADCFEHAPIAARASTTRAGRASLLLIIPIRVGYG
jgi:hypothetical protein